MQENAFALPHNNQDVEGTFNIMDDLAAVGGPVMSKSTLDIRMKAYVNQVLAERPVDARGPSGKRKQYHWTKQQCKRITAATVNKAVLYPEPVLAQLQDGDIRALPSAVDAFDEAALHAQPSRRADYSAADEAIALAVPMAGKCHSA